MKKIIYLYIIVFITISVSCNKQEKENESIAIKINDTINDINTDSIIHSKDSIITILSNDLGYLLIVNDSLNEELFVSNYKLERIAYYNDIAKNGNNIKFLRGWINRVLIEHK